jgi:hypothetical protein
MRTISPLVIVLISACYRPPAATIQPLPAHAPVCSETRSGETISVTCRAYEISPSYNAALFSLIYRMAAESTLAAGKSHFASLGGRVLQIQSTQPVCHEEQEHRFASALAAGMQSYADSMASQDSTTDCSFAGNQAHCRTTSPPPRPVRDPPPARYKTVCEGGGVLQSIDSVAHFEMLDATQAAARRDPLIPLAKRPIEARAVLMPRSAAQPVPTTHVAPQPADANSAHKAELPQKPPSD